MKEEGGLVIEMGNTVSSSGDPYTIASFKLYYFNIKGLGEPIRLAAHYAGLKFEDIRLDREAFQKMKQAGELPFGQVHMYFCKIFSFNALILECLL